MKDQTQEREVLTLKWRTLKAWKFNEGSPAYEAAQRYFAEPVAFGAAQQDDTDAQKQALCDVIDALNADTVHLAWDGVDVSKEEAKRYVMGATND